MGNIYKGATKIYDGETASLGDAVAGDIRTGKKAVVANVELTGTMEEPVERVTNTKETILITKSTDSFTSGKNSATDLSTGKTAIESDHEGTYEAANSIDDNTSTEWRVYNATSANLIGKWIGVDLGAGGEKRVGKIVLNTGTAGFGYVEIDYSGDGTNWTLTLPQHDMHYHGGVGIVSFIIPPAYIPIAARYWRIRCKTVASSSTRLYAKEIQYYEYTEVA